jgi:FkbM family methyltransferase
MRGSYQIKQTLISLGLYRPVKYMNDRLRRPDRRESLRRTMAIYSQFIGPGDLCFDVGANVGEKTEAMLRLGARVVAIEPQPSCVRELNALFKDNRSFQCVPKAIGRAPGTARMHVSRSRELSSLRADWFDRWESSIEVEMSTLDRLIDEYGMPVFCKIDVEGLEFEVLNGLSRPPKALSLEYHVSHLDETNQCLEYLARFGAMRLNISRLEEMSLLSETWWDRETFGERFREELEHRPEDYWGGDIYVQFVGEA